MKIKYGLKNVKQKMIVELAGLNRPFGTVFIPTFLEF